MFSFSPTLKQRKNRTLCMTWHFITKKNCKQGAKLVENNFSMQADMRCVFRFALGANTLTRKVKLITALMIYMKAESKMTSEPCSTPHMKSHQGLVKRYPRPLIS